jgi:predicted RNase H-like HicB family nuclease
VKYIILTIVIQREGDYYVSKCVELGTASFGHSKGEAVSNIRDAIELHLNTLEDLGECETALRAKGITDPRSDVPAADEVTVHPQSANTYSQILPLLANTKAETETALNDLRSAAESSLGFWDNRFDDEDCNHAQAE